MRRTDFLQTHGTDLQRILGPGDLSDYFINFVNTLDPNSAEVLEWPRYSSGLPALLTLTDQIADISVSADTFREEQIEFLNQLALKYTIGPLTL